jgi:RimJ/RimL family protein N-acetyltransferase
MLTVPDPPLTDGQVGLRRWRPGDGPDIVAACADREIGRWTTVPWPYGDSDARAFLDRAAEDWRAGRSATFAVVDVAGGQPVDEAALVGSIEVRLAPGESPSSAEAGYWVAPWARQRGVATAALALVTDWALRVLDLRVMTLQVIEGNQASMRVAERAGYHRAGRVEADVDGVHHATVLFARLAPRV